MIQIDVGRAIAEMRSLQGKFPKALKAGLVAVANDTRTHVAQEVSKIYNRPIPSKAEVAAYRRRAGRTNRTARESSEGPAWERTGGIQSGITMETEDNKVVIAIKGPAEKYAGRRHELGKSWTPRRPALGVIRKNTFFDDAAERMEPKAEPIFENAFENELGA